MNIFSWNVNGLRAVLKKGAFQSFIEAKRPDILCLQETKAKPGQAEVDLPDYEELWNSAERPGYSGTAIFTKMSPSSMSSVLPTAYAPGTAPGDSGVSPLADCFGDPLAEGRVQTAEFADFYLVNIYTPNSKRALERLSLRYEKWDPAVLRYLVELKKSKPVIVCGDFNAAHEEIDLARPKFNHKNAGFTNEERQGISHLLEAGFIDTFRLLHPDEQRYTWWSHWGHARENNVGWRIDYFFISEDLLPHLKAAEIYENFTGSDHCPISIDLDFTI